MLNTDIISAISYGLFGKHKQDSNSSHLGACGYLVAFLSLIVMPLLNANVRRLAKKKNLSNQEKRILSIYSTKFQQMATQGYMASTGSCFLRTLSHSSFNHMSMCMLAGLLFSQS